MKAKHIIKHVAKAIGMDHKEALKMAKSHMESGAKKLQHDDTLMFYKPIGKNSLAVHFVTADSPLQLVSSLKHFQKILSSHGIEKVYTNSESSRIKTALGTAGIPVEESDKDGYKYMGKIE